MKVLNIVKYYYPSVGGMETYVGQLCRGIKREGIMPNVLTLNHISRVKTMWEIIDGISVRRAKCQLKLFSQPISVSFAAEMKRLAAEADLVHLHSPFPQAEVLWKFISKPLIITWCVDPVNTRWKSTFPLFRPFLIRALEMARKIILIAPNLLEYSPTLIPYEHKCEVIPLAYSDINASGNVPTVKKINKTKPVILFVGKLRKYKGVDYLLRAVQKTPEILLRIVGDGEESNNLRQLTDKLGINDRIEFLGNVLDEQLHFEYKDADIFVLPSVDASEAFGIVQAEAMSHGLPVINTNLPSGVPRVSLDGITGITVPPRDEDALISAIEKLCNDHEFYKNCSKNALERAKLYTEEKMIKSYLKVYRECV